MPDRSYKFPSDALKINSPLKPFKAAMEETMEERESVKLSQVMQRSMGGEALKAAMEAMGGREAIKTALVGMSNGLPERSLIQEAMKKIAAQQEKTSDKIRLLAEASVPRADIARHLGIRYQHVRNVLVRDEAKAASERPALQKEAEIEASATGLLRSKLGPAGRVVIPAPVREKLGLDEGAELVFTLDGDEVRVASMTKHLKRLQERVRKLLPEETSLVDELIAERRREAGNE